MKGGMKGKVSRNSSREFCGYFTPEPPLPVASTSLSATPPFPPWSVDQGRL